MGKSKSKKVQLKRYPTPTDRYLIVTDPWGGVPVSEPDFFNNVTAWFEIMFKPKYPGVRPSAIFYQWTGKNIIVEIPDYIEVEEYLGAHYWSTFLAPPHCYQVGTRVSYVYEFEHRFFPTPASQGGWTADYAKYTTIRSNFYVREPYPPPMLAPNSPLPYARKLPQGKVLNPGQALVIPPIPDDDDHITELRGESSRPASPTPTSLEAKEGQGHGEELVENSTEQLQRTRQARSPTLSSTPGPRVRSLQRGMSSDVPRFEEYDAPPHLKEARIGSVTSTDRSPRSLAPTMRPPPQTYPKLVKKMDPYEEEEASMAALRCDDSGFGYAPLRGISLTSELEVKHELMSGDDTGDREGGYMPSNELLEAFRTLEPRDPHSQLVPARDDDLPDFDDMDCGSSYDPAANLLAPGVETEDYKPSAELLAALASLPDGMVNSSQQSSPAALLETNQEQGFLRVKSEPEDDISVSLPRWTDRERSVTLGRADNWPSERRVHSRVKREPSEEEGLRFSKRPRVSDPVKKIKLER